MSEFGKFTEVTFVNSGAPAINDTNLNELERVVALTDAELAYSSNLKFIRDKEYYRLRNTNNLLSFTDYSDWTNHYPSQNDLSDEEDENLIGNNCLSMENLLATAGWMSISQTFGSAVDLTEFYDGSASSVDDCLIFFFYISDQNAFSNLEIRLGDDFSNCYFINLASLTLTTGWNNKYPQKSDFSTIGSPTGWNSISYVRIAPYALAGYANEYIFFQRISLFRQDPVYSGFSNVFQRYNGTSWENDFNVAIDVAGLYYDYGDFVEKTGYMLMNNINALEYDLYVYFSVINFRSRFEFYSKKAGECPSVVWRVNATNYFEVYVSSDTFYLKVTEAGAATTNSEALTSSLIKNERLYISVEKEGSTIRAILDKVGDDRKILEYTTSISATSDGDVCIGKSSVDSLGLLTDFQISNAKIDTLDYENIPTFISKRVLQEFSNNTLQNVTNMKAALQRDVIYYCEAVIIATCTSATPDVKIAWNLQNASILDSSRMTWGPPYNTTTVIDTNIKSTAYGTTTQVVYGCDGTGNETVIYEKFFIAANNENAFIQLQAAQSNTDGSNPVTIFGRSFFTLTKMQPQKSL